MAKKYALVNNGIVSSIKTLETEDLYEYINIYQIIDVEDATPSPSVGWVLNGNKLEIASGGSSREEYEEQLAVRKIEYGIQLAKICIAKIGARNKILNKSALQITTLLSQLVNVKLLLETGALGTARDACLQLKIVFTEYADIFDKVIAEVNSFENTFGL